MTAARLTERGHDEGVSVSSSRLRRKAATLTIDTDKKYAGKKTSRAQLDDSMGKLLSIQPLYVHVSTQSTGTYCKLTHVVACIICKNYIMMKQVLKQILYI